MRDYKKEFEERVAFVKNLVKESGANGIVYGNSGGKDCALVGIICKAACENTVGVMMPCHTKRNYAEDIADATALMEQFGIEGRKVDLTDTRTALINAVSPSTPLNQSATLNIAPRLRMTTLYSIAAAENRLVAGSGNRSEAYVGYFTKWGDGAYDFNVISDLNVEEIYDFLRYLKAPQSIIDKAPSAALEEGQTDESEMGVSYAELDAYMDGGEIAPEKKAKIDALHKKSAHKRNPIPVFKRI